MNGILLIDKPEGMTSHDVVRRVRKLCRTRRVGHTGTLDPMATGVLVVAVGEGTRIVEFLMEGRKSYRATMKLGETTDTQDSEGTLLSRADWRSVDESALRRVFGGMIGTLRQLPPMYSALKKNGVALHTLARQGVEVERETRDIEIFDLRILEIELPRVTFEVTCSKGTYVRTLAHDAGRLLGVGAHLTALRRIENSGFVVDDCLRLEELEQMPAEQIPGRLLTISAALTGWPRCPVAPDALARLRNGIPPLLEQVPECLDLADGRLVRLCEGCELVALARLDRSRNVENRGDFQLLRVFPRAVE